MGGCGPAWVQSESVNTEHIRTVHNGRRWVLDGHIAGAGTRAGTRLVLGAWHTSPWGAFADVMIAHPDGTRELLAPTSDIADFISGLYTFDRVRTCHVHLRRTGTGTGSRWQVTAAGLTWSFTLGGRGGLGALLRAVPPPLGSTLTWARAIDPIASRLLPGVHTHGSSNPNRVQWYAARDLHPVTDSSVVLDGVDQGALAPISPAPDFGFSSVPQAPGVVRVRSQIRELRPGD